jgi:hypothetical protein
MATPAKISLIPFLHNQPEDLWRLGAERHPDADFVGLHDDRV